MFFSSRPNALVGKCMTHRLRVYVLGTVVCFIVLAGLATIVGRCGVARLTQLFQLAAVPEVNVNVDAARKYQVLDGFGQAEPSVLMTSGKGALGDALRAQAIEKAFHQVGINMGIIGSLLESPGDYNQRRNDNGDPFDINWRGFSAIFLNPAKRFLLDLAKPYGFDNYYLGAEAPNVRWASPWLADIRKRDYNLFLDEAAEQVLANVSWWKNTYGEELRYYQLGNEQLSGNRASESPDGSGFGTVDPVQQMVDLANRAGARIRNAGFLKTRFMVGTEETEEISLHVAAAILADSEAGKYVGAIGYHTYPYHRGYSSVPFILCTSGVGRPDRERIWVRNQLRDLGRQYNVKVWMTENSHAGDPLSYDDFRARAIHIHDEFIYADASAYFGEASMWDLASQRNHFGQDNLYGDDNEGNVVLINNDSGRVDITGIGYAIGHYARWVKPGSVRVDATSSDPLVQITAFVDEGKNRIALVIINNARGPRKVDVVLARLATAGNLTGEQSTIAGYWRPVSTFSAQSEGKFSITVPGISVTSIADGKNE